MEAKAWYQSKTIWGALLAVVATAMSRFDAQILAYCLMCLGSSLYSEPNSDKLPPWPARFESSSPAQSIT